tara:strand:- start:304 stop:483 length:180 start_codon:yes stop_codon:yes gene_type:complete
MSENKIPCFYTSMIDRLESLDTKVNEIQKSIKIFKAMISERIDVEKLSEPNKKEDSNEQ